MESPFSEYPRDLPVEHRERWRRVDLGSDSVLGEHVSHKGLGVTPNGVSRQRGYLDRRVPREAGSNEILGQYHGSLDVRTPDRKG